MASSCSNTSSCFVLRGRKIRIVVHWNKIACGGCVDPASLGICGIP